MPPCTRRTVLGLCGMILAWTPAAPAADLASASYRLRGTNLNAGASPALSSTAPAPRFAARGSSTGQGPALGYGSAGANLRTALPGFWPIVAGAFPHLDVDADGVVAFADPDDDGDGLPDWAETNTGSFVDAANTGSDPELADSDGDGVADGIEVAQGTDPNDPQSVPPVPGLGWLGTLALTAAVLAAGLRRSRGRT